MLRLSLNSTGDDGEIRSRFKNAYERIAGSDDYARNQSSLRLILSDNMPWSIEPSRSVGPKTAFRSSTRTWAVAAPRLIGARAFSSL